ncbi:MAG: hypothetical protein OHK0023_24470 [Anaerolineae bacterium]
MAWTGNLREPNLHWASLDSRSQLEATSRLALGIQPRELRLLPLSGDRMQLLWLDRNTQSGSVLVGGTLTEGGELLRGPTEIGAAGQFSAVALPIGSVAALWTAPLVEGQKASTLYLGRIDAAGRPLQPVIVAKAAYLAAAALDRQDRLHMAWFAPSVGSLWSLMYAVIPEKAIERGLHAAQIQQVGVVRMVEKGYLSDLQLAVDEFAVYVLWAQEIVNVIETSIQYNGLLFPLEAPQMARPLPLNGLPAALRDVQFIAGDPPAEGYPVLVGAAKDAVVAAAVTEQGIFRVRQIPIGQDETIAGVAASILSNTALHLAWVSTTPQGRGALYHTVIPLPQPAVR